MRKSHRRRRSRIPFRSANCPSNRTLSSWLLNRSRSFLSRIVCALLDDDFIIRLSPSRLLGVLWDLFNNDGIVVSRCRWMSGLSWIFRAFLDNDPVVGSSCMMDRLSRIRVQCVLDSTFFIICRSRGRRELSRMVNRFFNENSIVRAGPRAIVEGGSEKSNWI